MTTKDMIWDVAVVGGGASGMMAAGRAAAEGARVVLIEKNSTLGKKLLITGGGRCNVTNAEFDTRTLLAKFNTRDKKTDQFLFSPFAQHGVQDSLSFFNERGMDTKVEANKRVFPVSDSAQSVWNVLTEYMEAGGVKVIRCLYVTHIHTDANRISYVQLSGGERIHARSYIFATGGKSRPETGSTGDGFRWLAELGHTIREPDASLVPLTIKDSWVRELSGVSLSGITITLMQDGKRFGKQSGGMVFTHKGISGPAVLNLSRDVADILPYGKTVLSVDLLPHISKEDLDVRLRTLLDQQNKMIKNVLNELIPSPLISVVLEQAHIVPTTQSNSITKAERVALGSVLKGLTMEVRGLLGVDKAIVTSGGVSLTEVDFRTMQSRIVENLYIIGDLLDIDRPSGGYSLQLCWTTGIVAGAHVAKNTITRFFPNDNDLRQPDHQV